MNQHPGGGDRIVRIGNNDVVLFAQFGTSLRDNGGYEEWFVNPASAAIPEPGTGALLLAGLLGMFRVMRRRIFRS